MSEDIDDNQDRTPWILIRTALRSNHKIMKLRKILSLSSRHEALGVVVDLFIHTCTNASMTGDLSKWAIDDIEDWFGWKGESGQLIEGLREAGFLEKEGVVVHDWTIQQKFAIRHRLRRDETKFRRPYSNGRPEPKDDSEEVHRRTKMMLAEKRAMMGDGPSKGKQ